ncbi:MAG TPA: hypothetical protein P5227_08675, partial [Emcibacteraceae bacterium]|nr:hypothetical protein [Emcibacteraceae bacterium]
RWRMHGADAAEVKAKQGKLLEGTKPPPSEQAVINLLADAGIHDPIRFFASLFWDAWVARRD